MGVSEQQLLRETAQVDAASVAPLPGSRKVYVEGSSSDIRVGMREISLTQTPVQGAQGASSLESNAPVRVYDTSGIYTDPDADIDVRRGLPALREEWISGRNDTEFLGQLRDSVGFARHRLLFLRFFISCGEYSLS